MVASAFELVAQVAEEPLAEVARNRVELLFLLPQLLVKFERVVSLHRVLLLAASLLIETGSVTIALLDHVSISAEFVVRVPTNKVHSGQLQLLVALTAVLLIEVLAGALHPQDVLPH